MNAIKGRTPTVQIKKSKNILLIPILGKTNEQNTCPNTHGYRPTVPPCSGSTSPCAWSPPTVGPRTYSQTLKIEFAISLSSRAHTDHVLLPSIAQPLTYVSWAVAALNPSHSSSSLSLAPSSFVCYPNAERCSPCS